MTRRTKSLILDGFAFLGFTALTSWRFTGIVVHEWLALVLLAMIVVHLLIHADWVEARYRVFRQEGWRRISAAGWLNLSLFLTMGTTLISGVVISKVALPNSLSPGAYLKWHSLHESATMATLAILGLHLAINWDLIISAFRRAASGVIAADSSRRLVALRPSRVAWLLGGAVLLSGAVVGVEALVPPATTVYIYTPSGKIEPHAPPPELTAIQPGSDKPDPRRGAPKLVVQLLAVGAAAFIGRRVLRLRLS
jgi:hypothetical protein